MTSSGKVREHCWVFLIYFTPQQIFPIDTQCLHQARQDYYLQISHYRLLGIKLEITSCISFVFKELFAYPVKSTEIRFDGVHPVWESLATN